MNLLPRPTCSLLTIQSKSAWCLLVLVISLKATETSQVSLRSSWKSPILNPFSEDELLRTLMSEKISKPIGEDSMINKGNTNTEAFLRRRIKYTLKKGEREYHNIFVREEHETPAGSDDLGSGATTDLPLNTCNMSNFCRPDNGSQNQWPWPLTRTTDVRFGRCFGNTAAATRVCLSDCEWDQVNCSVSDELQNILQLLDSQDVSAVVQELENLTRHVQRSPEPLSEIYLMQLLLSQATNKQKRLSQTFQQNFLSICSHILDANYRESSINMVSENDRYQAGTWLLQTMNEFGLYEVNVTEETILTGSQNNIQLQVHEPVTSLLGDSNNSVLVIYDGNNSVLISHGVYATLANFSKSTIASFVYANMTGFLPERRENSSDVKLAAQIVSSDVKCGEGDCNFLDNSGVFNIVIAFYHSINLLEELVSNRTLETICVYWEPPNKNNTGEVDAPFNHGHWSDANCNKNNRLSNLSYTVCECYSFGVFAVVLNQADKKAQLISDEHTLALKIIYSIGTSFSLLGLIFTACVFIGFKSLWSLQSCIRIQLCLILSLVVLTFAVGGEQFMNSLTLCTTFAVLKHYLLLVAFMWILIDGIILLVLSTVTTFSFKLRYYLVGFTVLAYGIPLLYMCLCLPLGFQLWDKELWGYGEPYGCFLRVETDFFISFLIPVIILLMVSTVIFVVALSIGCSQHCKQKELCNINPSFYPILTYASLLAYMGFTWLILPFSSVNALLYLSTILISFQGFFMFIVYVPCSKQVRELLRQNFLKSKYLYTIRRFEEPSASNHSAEAQKLSKLSKSQRANARMSMYEPSDENVEVHYNPSAVSQEMDLDIQPHQQRSMRTTAAVNPSDVSLWRLADRVMNKTNLQLEPTIEELEEKATVVTFL